MLQIESIRKIYKTGSLVQEALKGVSLSLRDNEFVAILGQSGSGKTTLLNIIGGLDRYNDGDLIINGVSTKRYSDRDWDSYRNHSVGFVFQSYNLIPHQSILSNVELALTIGGISSSERTARAKEALEKVGLSEHIHKKPSQLSGGQMQRVAIARALVNDPDILLADEPTGALDSDTSLQVMDLLKEVARDRLVVMVTHNPELAEKYATRIVTLKDGQITSDSDPYEPEQSDSVHKNLGKASMSLLTSLALSFNNLWTKKTRTILVSFAGSIGIIGIALILAMSNGANEYIHNVEEESLQSYPLQITDTSFDLTAMYAGSLGDPDAEGIEATGDQKEVNELQTITGMLSGVRNNDLKSLKSFFESDECDIDDYVQAIDYSYNLVPRIYKTNEKGDFRQVNPDTTFVAMGFAGAENSNNGVLSSFNNSDSFFRLPDKEELYRDSFDIKAGAWPENYNECVLVLSPQGRVADLTLYTMGLKDTEELDNMINAFVQGDPYEEKIEPQSYNYEDFLGIEFQVLPTTRFYSYDKKYKVWTDHSSDKEYLKKQLKDAEPLRIVGVVQPSPDTTNTMVSMGIGYHPSLTQHMIDVAADTEIVKQQIKEPEINIFTGKRFDEEEEEEFDMSKLFQVDEDAINDMLKFDASDLDLSNFDLSSLDFSNLDIDPSAFEDLMPELDEDFLADLLSDVDINMTEESMQELFTQLLSGYLDYIKNDPRADLSALPAALAGYLRSDEARQLLRKDIEEYIAKHSEEIIPREKITAIAEAYISGYSKWLSDHHYEQGDYTHISEYTNSPEAAKILDDGLGDLRSDLSKLSPTDEEINAWTKELLSGYEKYADQRELPSTSYMLNAFREYLKTPEAKKLISSAVGDIMDESGLDKKFDELTNMFSRQLNGLMQQFLTSLGGQIADNMETVMGQLMSNLSEDMLSGFDFNPDELAKLFRSEMSSEDLLDLMTSLLSPQKSTYENNLRKLGYADLAKPSAITIYPRDFESKNHIKQIISDYNARMKAAGEDDKVIEYTDLVNTLMGSVTTIINVISYVLIAFVAISLIVSSIMIGVITYISVLERRKEIGILRAIGASKRNISQVFNAETFIIGALAGIIGIGLSELIILIANPILHSLTGQQSINAILPPAAAGILILLSIVLTLIGGIIPSRKAAKSDPVAALRSE